MFTQGIRYMLIATFFFAIMNVLVKMIPGIPAIEIVFFRSVISLLISYAFLRHQNISVWGNKRLLLVLRGLVGAISLILYFSTLQYIPLASAVTLQFLSPIFTTVLGIMIVREKVLSGQWFFFIIAFLGVVIIQGVDPRMDWFYSIIGVISAFFAGLAYNLIRKIRNDDHPLVVVFYFPLITLPITGIYCLFFWVTPQGMEWLILLGVGLATQTAQYFMTMAYQNEELSRIVSLKYIGIIYALGFGYVFFGETYDLWALLGMVVVLLGVGGNIYYKHRMMK